MVGAIDAREAPRDAQGTTSASREVISASREVIDLCQSVSPAALFETRARISGECAAQ
jgi:hypothetical protein